MIIKGTSCAGAGRLAAHLLHADQNERIEVREIRGSVAADLRGALADMEAFAVGSSCRKPFYHASINTPAAERLTEAQWAAAIDRLEKALGLSDQARAVVVHEKLDREHTHIVWARVDPQKGKAVSDSHNYRIHETVARSLERDFGLAPVRGVHVGRQGRSRPARTPSHDEMQQATRTGISPQDAKTLITGLWRGTKTGKAFAASLKASGWALACGDRRDFVLIDPKGSVHSLARRIEGATAKTIRARLADIDPASLPSVKEARAAMQSNGQGDSAAVVPFPRRRSAANELAHHRDRGRPQRQAA